jgi:hypothetical protein
MPAFSEQYAARADSLRREHAINASLFANPKSMR